MAKPPAEPTRTYKAALYALQVDGDRSYAEYYARNQPRRSRSARELVETLDALGWLTGEARMALGLVKAQLDLELDSATEPEPSPATPSPAESNGHTRHDDRFTVCAWLLKNAGANGLKIDALVTAIGEQEGSVSYQDRNWRAPMKAEVGEFVDQGKLVRDPSNPERLYLPEFAPTES